ncbi:hypothetical protein F4825DRAFT_475802 [Nemania diffusa]|nr:hypothetical protein F4825DRAFT_475802 [Nemania diffusa]
MAEIAGLVLGAVPLIISALEHYEDLVEPTVAFIQWRGELSKVTRTLLLEYTTYEQNIRVLLKQVVSDRKLNTMINNPQSDLWKTDELADALRLRLGTAYQPSLDIVKEIEMIMVEIAGSLKIEGAEEVLQKRLKAILLANPPASKTSRFRQRFEFKKRLKQLGDCNNRLYGFLEKAGNIQDSASSEELVPQGSVRFTIPLHIVQKNATRIHRAGLLLEHRLLRCHRKGGKEYLQTVGRNHCFEFSFWRGITSSWLGVEFSLDGDLEDTASLPHAPKVTYTFADLIDENQHMSPLAAPGIGTICSSIRTAVYPLVGFYLGTSDVLRGLYQVQSRLQPLFAKHVTMSELLPRLKQSLRDQYSLAVTMASSVLQLGETPWLHQPWCKSNVIFLRHNNENEQLVDLNHPYLMFIQPAEIYFGVPLRRRKRQATEESGPEPDVDNDLLAAHTWIQTQHAAGNLSDAFSKAATFCLQCYLDPSASFGDQHFVQAIQMKVLAPLEREMQMLLHGE